MKEDYELWQANCGKGKIFINPFNTRAAGLIILLDEKVKGLSHEIIIEGRCQLLTIMLNETSIKIIYVYAPNKDKEQLLIYRNIQAKIKQHGINRLFGLGWRFQSYTGRQRQSRW